MSDAQDGKAPVIASVAAAWRFFFAHWTIFIPGALFVAAASALGDLVQAVSANAAGPAPGAVLMFGALNLVSSAVFSAAVLRKAVRNETVGAFGLTFGADELRLIGVSLSLALIVIPIMVVGVMIVSFVIVSRLGKTEGEIQALAADPEKLLQAIRDSLGPADMATIWILMLAVIVLVVWAAVRLILINAATIGERRIMVFQTWRWTHGNFFRVLAAWVLTVAPVFLVLIFSSGLLGGIVGGKGAGTAIGVLAFGAVAGFISAMCQIPPLALAAHLYSGFRPTDLPPPPKQG
jgi:hypothetical protein